MTQAPWNSNRQRLAVVVVHYRTRAQTLRCLESLAGELGSVAPAVVAVVDNASHDGFCAELEELARSRGWSAWLRLVPAPMNRGFSAGCNLGIGAVDAEYYLLLNSDAVVQPGALAELLEAADRHPRAGVLGPRLLHPDGSLHWSCFRLPGPLSELLRAARTAPLSRLLASRETLLPHPEEPAEAGWISFACALLRRDAVEDAGPLDEGFFLYFEDVDYCRRVRAAGWTVVCWPRARVLHDRGRSGTGWDAGPRVARPPAYYYASRARYFAKHSTRAGLWLANLFWMLGRCVSWSRETFGRKQPHLAPGEARDIWRGALRPLRPAPGHPPPD